MKLADIVVEVRDKSLTRLGNILHEDLDLEYTGVHNNVGGWQLTLPIDHPMAEALTVPGAGIIVSGPTDILFSGPMTSYETSVTPEDPGGTTIFEGITDTVAVADALAYADPLNGHPNSATTDHDVRTAAQEALMHQYVNANIGPTSGSAYRRNPNLIMGPDLGRGDIITKRPRYQVLGQLLAEIARSSFSFRVVQRDDKLSFETDATADRTGTIRLDTVTGTLAGQRVKVQAPTATVALIAGQGEGVDRHFEWNSVEPSITLWGRKIERFVDQRQTNDSVELGTAASELFGVEGFATAIAQVIPVEDSFNMEFGVDWNMGDKISVVSYGVELAYIVNGVVMKINSDGFKLGIALGASSTTPTGSAASKMLSVEERVAFLERDMEPPMRDGAANVPSLRTLGTGALQAAAGDHTHPVDDTGWIALTPEPGYAWRTGFEGGVRRVGTTVYVKGVFDKNVGTWTSSTTPVYIPIAYRPSYQIDFVYMVSGTAIQAYVGAGGNVTSFASTGGAGKYFPISNTWPLG